MPLSLKKKMIELYFYLACLSMAAIGLGFFIGVKYKENENQLNAYNYQVKLDQCLVYRINQKPLPKKPKQNESVTKQINLNDQ